MEGQTPFNKGKAARSHQAPVELGCELASGSEGRRKQAWVEGTKGEYQWLWVAMKCKSG